MPATYPTPIAALVEAGVTIDERKGRNGRRIFIASDPAREVHPVQVLVLDLDDAEPWFAASGPTVESVEQYIPGLK